MSREKLPADRLPKRGAETDIEPKHQPQAVIPMIAIDDLRLLQADFESRRRDGKTKRKKLERLRRRFIFDYSPSKLVGLTLDEFVQGKGEKSTFCYRLERETEALGHIQGSPAIKFGVYFDKKIGSYRFKKKHSRAEDALKHILTEYARLLKAGSTPDFDEIREVDVTPMVKGKLLFLYYPHRFLNIFSERHVDHFLAQLRLNDPTATLDLVAKKELLWGVKSEDEVFSSWSVMEFSEFLYWAWPPPSRNAKASKALKNYLLVLPSPEQTHPEFVSFELSAVSEPTKNSPPGSENKRSSLTNFQDKSRRNKMLGNHGEDVVLLVEKRALEKAGKAKLAAKVRAVCKTDDAAGYDILSFELDGTEKYIEVKTTTAKAPMAGQSFSFFLSANELEQARFLGRKFHIYVVFDAKSRVPKVLRLSNPAKLDEKKFLLEPTEYRARLCVSVE